MNPPINLYDIYRKVSARARAQKSAETQRMAGVMREAADRIVDNPSLLRVKDFRKAEYMWYQCPDVRISGVLLADHFETAIRSKEFVSVRSYFDPRGSNGDRQFGMVYCAMSASKPGQFKLGFTTLKLATRLQKIPKRHGIEKVRPLFAINLEYPAGIEAQAKKKLRHYLVAGNTKGDSNEWYYSPAIQLARNIVAAIEENCIEVSQVTLYEGCPNPSGIKSTLLRLGADVSRESWR
jgi:hypothetical protein